MSCFIRKDRARFKEPFIISDYDPNWPTLFSAEKSLIQNHLGPYLLGIEHIGSTSVPGLAAKPIIDILVVLPNFSHIKECVQAMRSLRYAFLGQCGVPGREYFKKPGFHVHMVEVGNADYLRVRAFVQCLRDQEELRKEYVDLKKKLVQKWEGVDNCHYKYGNDKTEFIVGVLQKTGLPPLVNGAWRQR
ncbi:hypothetical protein GGF37_004677 [Kickxella alabastrina]|nr:hypothetical protein GGF37_004677 [Kickxella alabastrina]